MGRDLHAALGVETPYHKWFPRMAEYGFEEGLDFVTVDKNVLRKDGAEMPQTQHDHQLTIPMAKEICMLQRSEKGKQCRQYFIKLEEAWNTPEQVMSRALKIAQKTIDGLTSQVHLMQPKAAYFDALVDRNLLTNFRDTAKELHTGQKEFIRFLMDSGYLYRDKRGKLRPAADKNKGLFEVKEWAATDTAAAGVQTLVTPKGRETFRLLLDMRK